MENFGLTMSEYATPQVMTVAATIAALWLGWKVTSGTLNVAGNFARKASFAGLASVLLMVSGLGGLGYGVGEIGSKMKNDPTPANGVPHVGFTNDELLDLAKNEKVRIDVLEKIVAYARSRDGNVASVSEAEVLKMIAEQKDPEVIKAILKVYDSYRERVDGQYAKMTAVPEKKMVAKVDYDLTTVSSDPFKIITEDETKATVSPDSTSIKYGWMSALIGAGLLVSGIGVFATRNNQRNPADPHHPNNLS